MKSLRKTIRKILLENNGPYEKIATLLCTRDPVSINQGMELAKAMGYITKSSYSGPRATHWNENLFNHSWMLSGVDSGLMAALKKHNKTGGFGNHKMWPSRSLDQPPIAGWHIEINAHEE